MTQAQTQAVNKPSRLNFTKMHGCGNDFMIIDSSTCSWLPQPEQIQRWANRHTGVGFDQCIIIMPSNALAKVHKTAIDFAYYIYNADGSKAGQCGNGARCVAEFIHARRLSTKNTLCLATPNDMITTQRLHPGCIRIQFAPPVAINTEQTLRLDAQTIAFTGVELANPHAVITVDDIDTAPVTRWGDPLSCHAQFPDGANIEFVHVMSRSRLGVRVRERGVGETQACGTGAMAAMIACRSSGLCNDEVTVSLPGGDLIIGWRGANDNITMTGPAVMVYDGTILT